MAMDPALQMWPMNLDVNGSYDGQQNQQGVPVNASSPSGVFMGATTPNMMG